MLANDSFFCLPQTVRMALLETVREDDFVEYFIFPTCKVENDETLLKELQATIYTSLEKYLKQYIWHRDEFKLNIRCSRSSINDQGENALPPHLYGTLYYGENIEDEWFLVFLLLEITKEIPEICARIVDNDGEFLLIEAANYLPNWAKPETCEKRVYIYRGKIHILKPEKDEMDANISEAIGKMISKPEQTKAAIEIQNSILNRIRGYPKRIIDNLHRVTVYVPVGVAAILNHQPKLIAPAVRTFCNRDTIDLKACRAMKFFPPENRIYTSVVMTKFLYAMLINSKYVPDRRIGWNLPVMNSPNYKKHMLGIKIACGFEILASQANQTDSKEEKNFQIYLKHLKEKGYFKDYMEHSEPYNALLNKARDYFCSFKDTMQSTDSEIGTTVLHLVKNLNYNIEDLCKQENNLPEEDSDSWLNIDPKELDKMLEEQYGFKNMSTKSSNINGNSLSGIINSFLNHASDIEGAEFPEAKCSNDSPVRPPRGIKKGKNVSFTESVDTKEKVNDNKVNFDPSLFSCAVQNMLDLVIPEDNWDLESDSDMSTYGEEDDMVECENVKSKMKEYMDVMDKELESTTIGKSFVKKENDTLDNVEDFIPVDIDMNALKNILESYQMQMGEAGPASNMLGPMGVNLAENIGQKNENNDKRS